MENIPDSEPESPSISSLAAIIPAKERTLTVIPTQVRRNYVKAMKQLCTEAARRSAEVLEAAIFETELEGTNAQLGQPATPLFKGRAEYIREAGSKFAQRVVREQVNLDKTAAVAHDELARQPVADSPVEDISEDFLNVFEREASQMSTEGMRRLFGRILAAEVRRPTSFSIKSVRLAAQLDNSAASAFRNFCSLSCAIWMPNGMALDVRVCALGMNANSNGLTKYALSFDVLNMLQEYGLIISDYNSYIDYSPTVAINNSAGLAFSYLGSRYVLVPKTPITVRSEFRVHGVALSKSGRELAGAIEQIENPAYSAAIRTFFDSQGFTMTKL